MNGAFKNIILKIDHFGFVFYNSLICVYRKDLKDYLNQLVEGFGAA